MKLIRLLCWVALLVWGCELQQQNQQQPTEQAQHWQDDRKPREKKKFRNKKSKKYDANVATRVPGYALEVLAYIKQNGEAPEGYVGGRKFGNFERRLPQTTDSGQRIKYQEWDVHPRKQGRNRGAERLVTGSDDRSWYTEDHYDTFVEVKEE